MVREGIPFVLIPAIAAAAFGIFHLWPLVILMVAVALFMIYFFRDPRRTIPVGAGLIVSSADGRVTRIDEGEHGKTVSVFLSPLNVHINRSPIAGRIDSIAYTAGKKMPATRNEASLINERNSLVIVGEEVTVTCTQIAGILARRIVCWSRTGDNLERGQKFGMIKFGSRTDILMPATVELAVGLGDKVLGGETIIGRVTGLD